MIPLAMPQPAYNAPPVSVENGPVLLNGAAFALCVGAPTVAPVELAQEIRFDDKVTSALHEMAELQPMATLPVDVSDDEESHLPAETATAPALQLFQAVHLLKIEDAGVSGDTPDKCDKAGQQWVVAPDRGAKGDSLAATIPLQDIVLISAPVPERPVADEGVQIPPVIATNLPDIRLPEGHFSPASDDRDDLINPLIRMTESGQTQNAQKSRAAAEVHSDLMSLAPADTGLGGKKANRNVLAQLPDERISTGRTEPQHDSSISTTANSSLSSSSVWPQPKTIREAEINGLLPDTLWQIARPVHNAETEVGLPLPVDDASMVQKRPDNQQTSADAAPRKEGHPVVPFSAAFETQTTDGKDRDLLSQKVDPLAPNIPDNAKFPAMVDIQHLPALRERASDPSQNEVAFAVFSTRPDKAALTFAARLLTGFGLADRNVSATSAQVSETVKTGLTATHVAADLARTFSSKQVFTADVPDAVSADILAENLGVARLQPQAETTSSLIAATIAPLSGPTPKQVPESQSIAMPQPVALRDVPKVITSHLETSKEATVTLRLDPTELGSVQVVMQPREKEMAIAIIVERPETLDLLRRHADQFVSDLRQSGYSGASLTFSMSDQQTPSQRHSLPPMVPEDDNAQPSALGKVSAPPPPVSRTSVLDMRL